MFGSGDGWVRCREGHPHWGLFGAAGLLLTAVDEAGVPHVLLQLRAGWSHHGGTWGVPGGARHDGESAESAALREVREEVELDLNGVRLVTEHVDDHGGWAYITVIGAAEALLPAGGRSAETAAVRWVPVPEVDRLALHPGFEVTWPLLRPHLPG